MDENTIVKNIQNGQTQQFAELYDAYAQKIYSYFYFRLCHKETAEDLTSAVFFKAIEKIYSFNRQKGAFSAWLYTIARNTLFDYYRIHKEQHPLTEAENIRTAQNIERELDAQLGLEKIRALLQTMSKEQQDIVVMRIWDGLSYQEIAAIAGKNETALRMAFSRALAKIKAELPTYVALVCFFTIKTWLLWMKK